MGNALNSSSAPETLLCHKVNRVLQGVFLFFLLLAGRIWHLAAVQHEEMQKIAARPQRKTVLESAKRASIRDRFSIPLAINQIRYQATIIYADIRQIPLIGWETGPNGQRIKFSQRKRYISSLAQFLGKELLMDPDRVEDLIYAKASFYAHRPFVLKDDLSEESYYRLKSRESRWPGLVVQAVAKRYYPWHRTGGDLLGYMGTLNEIEYEKILQEIHILEQEIAQEEFPAEKIRRLRLLQKQAYALHDPVGKAGAEASFEKELRGFSGKKNYALNSKGNVLRQLPGSQSPIPGKQISLSISVELQAFAEQLLAANESLRIVRKSTLGIQKQTTIAEKHPWMKGGAIIAMDPKTGEILALASYPRMDPNDFIPAQDPEVKAKKNSQIAHWFENESYLASLWEQKTPLTRERFQMHAQSIEEEKLSLSWSAYLNLVLPIHSPVKKILLEKKRIEDAITVQKGIHQLQTLFPGESIYSILAYLYPYHIPLDAPVKQSKKQQALLLHPQILGIKKQLDPYFIPLEQVYDQVLLADLYRLAVDPALFSEEILQQAGKISLEDFKEISSAWICVREMVKKEMSTLFREHSFKMWRKEHEKSFLKEKREAEKRAKAYPKPYLDYIDKMEKKQFQEFWEEHQNAFFFTFLHGSSPHSLSDTQEGVYFTRLVQLREEVLLGIGRDRAESQSLDQLQKLTQKIPKEQVFHLLRCCRRYADLQRPLLGRYRHLRGGAHPLEKHLATAFYPVFGYGYGRSFGFRQATIQGSLFKLVTSYAALQERYQALQTSHSGKAIDSDLLNPLIISDQVYTKGGVQFVGYTQEGKPIPQLYKGGRLPRSLAHRNSGTVNLIRALEVSSNPYFSLLAGECLKDPQDLVETAKLFSFGEKTGIELPGEIRGHLPQDLSTNRTGLYATAIGQHSLVVTPLQTAVMLSAIANGGQVLRPTILKGVSGNEPTLDPEEELSLSLFPLQDTLSSIGVHFPLFTALLPSSQARTRRLAEPRIKRQIGMPEEVRNILLRGLQATVLRTYQEGFTSLLRLYQNRPQAMTDFAQLKSQFVGKTSTSESVENLDLDRNEGTAIYTHVWFGCIAFQEPKQEAKTAVLWKKELFGEPELVVVVYLRFGGYGKEAAPVAAEMIKKWRSIRSQNRRVEFTSNYVNKHEKIPPVREL